MRFTYRFLTPAEEEMIEAAVTYNAEGPGWGQSFLDDVQRAINTLRSYPEAGSPLDDHLRRILLSQFPFSLIYTFNQEIVIIAVAHHRRQPKYWSARLNE